MKGKICSFMAVMLIIVMAGCTPTPTHAPTIPATATLVTMPTAIPPTEPATGVPTEQPTDVPSPEPTAIPSQPTATNEPISPLPTATMPVSPLPTPSPTLMANLLPETGTAQSVSPPQVELSGVGIAAAVAFLLSIALRYTAFSAWWTTFAYKREALAGTGFVVAWAMVGLHYLGAVDLGLGAFGWPVVRQVIESWLAFSGAGQLMYTGQEWMDGLLKHA